MGDSLGSFQRNPVGGVIKGFKGGAYWMSFESNSRTPGNLLPDSLRGVPSLSLISGVDKIERVEGEGEAGEHCPRYICLSIRCLYAVVGDGGGGGKWNGMQVADPSLACASGGELR
jgi:hypothetical protein